MRRSIADFNPVRKAGKMARNQSKGKELAQTKRGPRGMADTVCRLFISSNTVLTMYLGPGLPESNFVSLLPQISRQPSRSKRRVLVY